MAYLEVIHCHKVERRGISYNLALACMRCLLTSRAFDCHKHWLSDCWAIFQQGSALLVNFRTCERHLLGAVCIHHDRRRAHSWGLTGPAGRRGAAASIVGPLLSRLERAFVLEKRYPDVQRPSWIQKDLEVKNLHLRSSTSCLADDTLSHSKL